MRKRYRYQRPRHQRVRPQSESEFEQGADFAQDPWDEADPKVDGPGKDETE
jgi:hypothetical protein